MNLKKIMLVAGVSLLLVGCGNSSKNITCTNSFEDENFKSKEEVTISFKDNKISKTVIKESAENLNSESTDKKLIEVLKTQYENMYGKYENVESKISGNDSDYTITRTVKSKNLTNDDYSTIFANNTVLSNVKIEDKNAEKTIKISFEDAGYICK
ncbi:MAG: hypothetical protein ACK5HL_01085 [Bacilli bacterium]